jgi:hypothetical protein
LRPISHVVFAWVVNTAIISFADFLAVNIY